MKKGIFFTLALLLATLVPAQKKLHLILLINTEEEDRTVDRLADFNGMYSFWEKKAKILGIDFSPTHLGKEQFNRGDVIAACTQLKVTEDQDIIIFYYSGHGENDAVSKWPTFNLTDGKLAITEVTSILNGKGAKFSLAIGDCCNVSKKARVTLPPLSNNPPSKTVLEHLFYGFKGQKVGIISTSSLGELSRSHPTQGSFWGYIFRSVFNDATNNSQKTADWNTLLEKVKKEAAIATATYGKQTAKSVIGIPPTAADPFKRRKQSLPPVSH